MTFKLVKSAEVNFTTSEQIFYGLPTPTGSNEDSYRYQIDDTDSLSAGLHYYYRVYGQNATCGPANITCSPFSVGGRNATGLSSRPMQIVGDLLDSSRIKLDWILLFDTGQGGGNKARCVAFVRLFPIVFFPAADAGLPIGHAAAEARDCPSSLVPLGWTRTDTNASGRTAAEGFSLTLSHATRLPSR